MVYTERKIADKASGQLVATVTQTTFCRADGGFGGPPRESPPSHKLPERAPDLVCDLETRRKWRWSIGSPPTSIRCTPISMLRRPQAFRGRSCTA